MDFNETKSSYREIIERSIGFSGKGLDFFTQVKADHMREIAARLLPHVQRPRLLDIGCGHGLMHPYLLASGFDVVGVEVAAEVLALANGANPQVRYVAYDGRSLPFAASSFDVALAVCVMHHVAPEQWRNFLREIRRVLLPGGLAVVFEHNPLNPLTRYVVASNEIDVDAHLVSARTLRSLMRETGFAAALIRNILFTPFAHPGFRWLDDRLGWLPLGAQYYAVGTTGA